MEIREKYNIEDSGTSFSFQPFKPVAQSSWRVIGGLMIAAAALFFFQHILDKTLWISLYVMIAYFVLQSLYDVLMKANVRYTFCSSANAVYRSVPFAKEKQIMTLAEMIIFTSAEMGTWHYSIGAKKSQFVRSYNISESFGSGKKSDARRALFDQEILERIAQLKSTIIAKI
jgi:hypothetical protein